MLKHQAAKPRFTQTARREESQTGEPRGKTTWINMGCFNGWEKTIGWEPCKGVRNTPQTWKHFQDGEKGLWWWHAPNENCFFEDWPEAWKLFQDPKDGNPWAWNDIRGDFIFVPLCPARLPLPCSALLYFTLVYVLCFALRWSTYVLC